MTEQNKKTNTDVETVAFHKVINDAYKQRYKMKAFLFSKLLKHMLGKMGVESTLFLLMEEVQKNRV